LNNDVAKIILSATLLAALLCVSSAHGQEDAAQKT
jgi:hypothetical protein